MLDGKMYGPPIVCVASHAGSERGWASARQPNLAESGGLSSEAWGLQPLQQRRHMHTASPQVARTSRNGYMSSCAASQPLSESLSYKL